MYTIIKRNINCNPKSDQYKIKKALKIEKKLSKYTFLHISINPEYTVHKGIHKEQLKGLSLIPLYGFYYFFATTSLLYAQPPL